MMRLQTSTSRKARILSVAAALVVGAALAVGTAIAQQNQNFDNVQIDTVKVRDNVYMLVGAGGNTTVFTGSDGIMVVDTQFAPLEHQDPQRHSSDQRRTDPLHREHARARRSHRRQRGDRQGRPLPRRRQRRRRPRCGGDSDRGDHRARKRAEAAERRPACRAAAGAVCGVADGDLHHQEARVPVQRRGRADHPRAGRAHRRRQPRLLPQGRRRSPPAICSRP